MLITPPPYSRIADIAVSLSFLPYITITPISPRPPFGATMFSSLWLLVFIVEATPPTDAQSIHLSLSILAIIYHHHSSVAHPVVAEEVGHGVLEISCRDGSRHPTHGTVNHFPHHVICVLSHRYNHLRLPLLKYITTRRNSNSHCQTGNRLHTAPNSFSYLGGVFSINDFTPLHISISFSYYYISDTTRINPRPNTWRHIVVVIHFFKLEITNTPLTALL